MHQSLDDDQAWSRKPIEREAQAGENLLDVLIEQNPGGPKRRSTSLRLVMEQDYTN